MRLKLEPTYKQHLSYELLKDKAIRYLLFGGGAGGGKSWLGCEWLLQMCILYPGSKWFVGRKELKSLMGSTFITWQKVCRHHGIDPESWKLNSKYNYIEFVSGKAKGSRIDLLDVRHTPSDPVFERFGSLEFTGGWLEEAGEIAYLAFDVLKSRIGRHNTAEILGVEVAPKMLLTCNPTQNWLFRIFYKPHRDGSLPKDLAFIRALHDDNPHHPSSYAEQLASISDPILRARLYAGDWEYSVDDLALVNYEAILDLFTAELDEDASHYITADIARYGSDKSVIGVWEGLNLTKMIVSGKQSLEVTTGRIRDLMESERIPYRNVVVDEDGVGGGVVDALNGVQGFMGNRAPLLRPDDSVELEYLNVPKAYLKKENYKNLRSQCHFLLAHMINTHRMAITAKMTEKEKEMVIEELRQIKRVDTSADEALRIVPKDMIKEALGRSPDFSDMMMMRMYFEMVADMPKSAYNPVRQDVLPTGLGRSDFGGVPFDL